MQAAQATLTRDDRLSPAPAAAGPVRAVAFDGCLGQLHGADGPTGVLMCSPWGYEELCARKSWRLLAEAIAAVGAPCLRFDYPGTGDSLDVADVDLDAWVAAADAAARTLRQETGVRRLIIVGQGLGAMVARLATARIGDVAGLVLLAPAVSGRAHLRELAMWGSVVAASIKLPLAVSEGSGVAGFVLPPRLAAQIKAVDQTGDASPGALVIERADYEGYEALLTDPTTAVTPGAVIARVADWIAERQQGPARAKAKPSDLPPVLAGPGFVETPIRFGDAELFGVVCRPAGPRRGRTVLLLNSGYDPHTGWARSWVEQARTLAAQGVATLRMDASGVGDSPARAGAPDQVLYSDIQLRDARQAIDWLEAEGLGPVALVGRCSGAYLGLRLAIEDVRVAGLVMVNPLRLVWRPGESVDAAIRSASLSHYRARALQPQTVGRILRGEVDVGRLGSQLLRRMYARLAAGSAGQAALRGEVRARFAALRRRGMPVTMAYSDGDDGLIELATWFGKDGKGLAAYPNVRRVGIADADHNLTPPAARSRLIQVVADMALGG